MARMSFTPAPGVNVSDADAAVGEVKDGKFFYSVEQPRKEGTMPTEAIVAGAETYAPGYHAGNVGGLSAIDPDLAEANIKVDVDIFGVTGTFESVPTMTELWFNPNQQENVGDVWEVPTGMTGLVPEDALIVIISCAATTMSEGADGDIRVNYNGVEKATIFIDENNARACRWVGEGLGFAATADMEIKLDSGTSFTASSGGVWYLTF